MPDATFARPDLTTFCRLDELGLAVTGQTPYYITADIGMRTGSYTSGGQWPLDAFDENWKATAPRGSQTTEFRQSGENQFQVTNFFYIAGSNVMTCTKTDK